MNLTLVNNTATARSYLSGAITLAATIGATATVTSTVQQLAISTDGLFKQDIFQSNIYITDGTNNYGVNDGITYLNLIGQNLGPSSDGVGNQITSTLNGSKQRLDTDLASEGSDGSTAPTTAIQIAGKDGNGNLQFVQTDSAGVVYTTSRVPLSGSSPSAVSVGVSSVTVIVANAARRGLVLTNTSTGIVSFNINGGTAILRSGITLYPGGHWEMDEFTFTTNGINGISSVAASNVAIQELT